MMFACGILGFLGFKVFEIGDAIVGPFWDNSRYDDLRSRYDLQKHSGVKIAPIPLVFVNSSQRQVMVPGIVMNWRID